MPLLVVCRPVSAPPAVAAVASATLLTLDQLPGGLTVALPPSPAPAPMPRPTHHDVTPCGDVSREVQTTGVTCHGQT